MAKTPEEKEAEKVAKEAARELAEQELAAEAAVLKAESERVEAEQRAKDEAKRKDIEARQGTPEQERTYTKAEVQAMLKQFALDLKNKGEGEQESLDEEDPYKVKQVTIPRFVNKDGVVQFVIGFKNKNIDPYFPDSVIQSFDVWNSQTKRNDPWVTLVYEDKSEMDVPLQTVIKKSQVASVDLIEVIPKDKSYSAGKTERAEVKDYSRGGTGTYVKMKVTMADYSYLVKLPSGKEVEVGKEVINWKH